jgi:hypothetical protein
MKQPGEIKTDSDKPEEQKIDRRKAIQKMGYAAFASSTMLLLLNNPKKAHASSPSENDPGNPGGGNGEWGDDLPDPWDDL